MRPDCHPARLCFVGELEVEERAHIRLAGCKPNRRPELTRLLRRRQRRHVLAPVVVTAERRRYSGLESVFEVPDLRSVAERRLEHAHETRVVALAEEPRRVRSVRELRRSRRVRVVPERVNERPRPARSPGRRRRRRGGMPPARGPTLSSRAPSGPADAACRSSERAAPRTPTACRPSTCASSPRSTRRRRAHRERARAPSVHRHKSEPENGRLAAYRVRSRTQRARRSFPAQPASARASSTSLVRDGCSSPCHGTHTRTASAPSERCQRTTPSGSAVHFNVSSSTPTSSLGVGAGRSASHAATAPTTRSRAAAISRRLIRDPAAIVGARASRLRRPCEGRAERTGRRSTRGRARASRPSTSRSRAVPARAR